ncbi:zinc finger with KRAB and SCAN domains 5-like [Solea senegalensis]|uniref:Zinc finger with KRAB and SCAN domains 5-like n=1 Tax=Solea senegalensis TaxID=28829 RepID=A0AAV6SXQ1_SOLSE|nr:zinc finger protein 184-like [Solea senegalensis]KAG7521461.1 zinc finger with KRAB and SCAN domains 5-like [Solea senegalensis]
MKNLDCCVSGCENLRTSSTKVKFYRLPSGHQVNRRRLWLQAIQQANGSTKELNGNARVCGAHFTSRVASMDPNSPDFVPSVFTKRSPKKKAKKYFTGKRRRLHKTIMSKDNLKSPSKADSPVDDQSSVLMDTNTELSPDEQTPSASSITKDESEVTTIKPQASTPNKTSPSVKVSACTLNINKTKPIVLLKRIVVPESGYWCALSNEDSTAESRLVRDIQLHEEQTQLVCVNCGMLFTNQVSLTQHCCAKNDEPSFPCNICHRSFTSSRYLKRHKLLHVKDARKCGKCGVLFCRRHNHVMSCPIAKAVPETEEDCSENEESNRYIKTIPEESKKMQEESYLMLEVSDLKPEVSDLMPEVSDLMPEFSDLMK